ncbi:hypothetical protein GH714_004628 [Hevea brasiliensis]|uniref:Uncharacterized protein n=1 Tax=Hevea brasiliensis TaxID=3981 RepID=A0A6A6MYX4_HEVBR|nr:hypothetical protein GH714_004628 [Hevea brasiliensis]
MKNREGLILGETAEALSATEALSGSYFGRVVDDVKALINTWRVDSKGIMEAGAIGGDRRVFFWSRLLPSLYCDVMGVNERIDSA